MIPPYLIALSLPQLTAAVSGVATYYGGNLAGGNCLFSGYSLPGGVFGTALAGPNWSHAGMCGACLRVAGPKGNIKVMVVDQCPECAPNQLDLFQNAFAQIGEPTQGKIPITWSVEACGIGGPLVVRNKSGTSKWWFSMQVVNANQQVTGLEVSVDGGNTWQGTQRQDYNYFEKSGGGGFQTDTVTVRVSCSNSAKVVLKNIGVASSTSYTASGNC